MRKNEKRKRLQGEIRPERKVGKERGNMRKNKKGEK